jgi:hypothetical protein
MRGTRHWSSVKPVLAILCAACFLTTSLGSVSRAIAADSFQVAADDTFETWPKKPTTPDAAPVPPASGSGAADAGDAAGTQTAKGMSAGTIGWIALGAAVVIGIAVAAGGGGGDGSTTPAH